MERLNFIEPPVTVERYNPKGLFSRRRVHGVLTQHEWILILADRRTLVRWVVPWWSIQSMVDTLRSPYVRVASLTMLTFYFPVRLRRQYGRRQVIPDTDTLRPLDKPMLRGNARSWEDYWRARPRTEVTPLAVGDAKVSRHYLAWINSSTAIGRAESRRVERDRRDRRDKPADLGDSFVSKAKPLTVKDRLGPKKVPVWDRLERLPPLTIDANVAERRVARRQPVEVEGKGKAVKEVEARKQKWKRKARAGECSGVKDVKEPEEEEKERGEGPRKKGKGKEKKE